MAFHMKTTFNIDDSLMARLRHESTRQGETITKLVESALCLLLKQEKSKNKKNSAGTALLRWGNSQGEYR